jgi:hypothetical protein
MDVGKEDLNDASGAEEVSQLEHWNKVTAMGASGGCSSCKNGSSVGTERAERKTQTPVDYQWPLLLYYHLV